MEKNNNHCKIFPKVFAQEAQSTVHMGLDSAHRQLQLLGNIAVVHTVEIAHAEHLTALIRQSVDGFVDHAAQVGILHLACRIVRHAAVILHTLVVYVVDGSQAAGVHVAALQRIELSGIYRTIEKRIDLVTQIYLVPTFP